MLGDGVNSMTYDVENRMLTSSNSSASGAYVYDGNGLRVKKCVPNCSSPTTTTVYIFSGSSVVAEYDNGAAYTSPTREYLFAGGLKVATVDTAMKYHLRDHLSVRVNTDSSGNIIGEQGHYPFGDSWYLNSTTAKEQFTTYERDPESGNDYAMARYNVNRLGRFSSVDPLSGSLGNPQSLNHYAYSLNDPINLVDPFGLDSCETNPGAPHCNVAIETDGGGSGCTLDGISASCGWVSELGHKVFGPQTGMGSGGGTGGGAVWAPIAIAYGTHGSDAQPCDSGIGICVTYVNYGWQLISWNYTQPYAVFFTTSPGQVISELVFPGGENGIGRRGVALQILQASNKFDSCFQAHFGANVAGNLLGSLQNSGTDSLRETTPNTIIPPQTPQVNVGDSFDAAASAFLDTKADCLKENPLAALSNNPRIEPGTVNQANRTWYQKLFWGWAMSQPPAK